MYSFHPGDAKQENHIIPDYTLYLIQITKDYYDYYGGEEILIQTFPHFQLAIEWFWKYIDSEDGLLGDLPHWCFIDWSFAHEKPGKWAILNTQFMDVLYFVAKTANDIGRDDLFEKYTNQADKMKESIDELFWDQEQRCYRDYYHEGRLHGFSYMTNSYLILKDVASRDKWDVIISRIFAYPGIEEAEKAQIDDFYLKNQSHQLFGEALKTMVVVAQPFFMHQVNKAFAKMGRFDLIMKYLKKWIPMLILGETGTIWETWSIQASECHAWAATPAYDLSTYWLGVKPLTPGFESVEISPTFEDLTHVSGIFPSCRGDIKVEWEKFADHVKVQIEIPKDISSGIFIPPLHEGAVPKKVDTKNDQDKLIEGTYSLHSRENSFNIYY